MSTVPPAEWAARAARQRPAAAPNRSNGSRRTAPLPPGWQRTRRVILARDHWMCTWVRIDIGEPCGEPARHVDHITPVSQGGSEDHGNLRSLCDHHVKVKDAQDAAQGRRKARASAWTPKHKRPKPHPGEEAARRLRDQ